MSCLVYTAGRFGNEGLLVRDHDLDVFLCVCRMPRLSEKAQFPCFVFHEVMQKHQFGEVRKQKNLLIAF